MSSILRKALTAVGEAIKAAAPSLAQVRVASAPPDEASQYPAVALVPEKFTIDTSPDDDIYEADGDVVSPGGRQLVSVGALRGTCRLFLAARLEGQRETAQDEVLGAFFQDDCRPSGIKVDLPNVEVGGVPTGVTWPVAVFLDDEEWRDELVFSERRWAFLRLSVDVPLLVLRNAPIVQTMVLALTQNLSLTVDDPTDLTSAVLAPLEQHKVASDGALSTYP
jgi:hypothetical protein